MKPYNRKLVLQNGQVFYGWGFGANSESISELVFNTSMVGYQELVSDPSYTGQMVCMTYPLIGNYGITDEDDETKTPTMGGLIVREYNDIPSNFRYIKTLSEVMEEYGIPGISGVDTRKITRIIRDDGSQKVLICDIGVTDEQAIKKLSEHEMPKDSVSRVSCKKRWYSRTPNHRFDVVAIDCGIKLSTIKKLNEKGCNVAVVPYDTTAEEIMKIRPDGLFLSNGPGNPKDVKSVINVVKELKGQIPMFGVCLGYQLMSLAMGADTFKMKFGHRGSNHPVMSLENGKVEITLQNHSYAVDSNSLEKTDLKLTHKNLLDNTAEGVYSEEYKMFGVQYHPEGTPAPDESAKLFDKFIKMMEKEKSDNA